MIFQDLTLFYSYYIDGVIGVGPGQLFEMPQ